MEFNKKKWTEIIEKLKKIIHPPLILVINIILVFIYKNIILEDTEKLQWNSINKKKAL